jgi:small subunit ribosomal protein S3
MGQKIHPVGLRLGITRTWDSRWFEKKNYQTWLHEDMAIRQFLSVKSKIVGESIVRSLSRVEIERRPGQVKVTLHTSKPGIIIGKRGAGIDEIRKTLAKMTGKQVTVNVSEIKVPELGGKKRCCR